MSRLLTDITSIYWWISVVIVGVLIHILGVFIARRLDTRLSKLSSWWRGRSEQRRLERRTEIAKLKSNDHEQVMAALAEISYRVLALVFGVVGTGFIASGGLFLGVAFTSASLRDEIIGILSCLMGALFILTAVSNWLTAAKKGRHLAEVRENQTATVDSKLGD
jgi:hypothetical protein